MLLYDISDDEWLLLKQRIPKADSAREAAKPAIRRSVNAILWRMRTGKPWRFMPSDYGEATSIFRRYQEWTASGVWEDVTKILADMRSQHLRQATPPAFDDWINDLDHRPDGNPINACEISA